MLEYPSNFQIVHYLSIGGLVHLAAIRGAAYECSMARRSARGKREDSPVEDLFGRGRVVIVQCECCSNEIGGPFVLIGEIRSFREFTLLELQRERVLIS